jgi:DNA-binding NtrC family response regulator
VLLVDDEESYITILSKRLNARGFKVDTATSGANAIDRVGKKIFDVIVLDLAMPEIDGLETLKRIKREAPEAQFIILTGQASVRAGIEALKEGALDILEKPVDLEQLMQKIGEAKQKKVLIIEKKHEDHVKEILIMKGW